MRVCVYVFVRIVPQAEAKGVALLMGKNFFVELKTISSKGFAESSEVVGEMAAKSFEELKKISSKGFADFSEMAGETAAKSFEELSKVASKTPVNLEMSFQVIQRYGRFHFGVASCRILPRVAPGFRFLLRDVVGYLRIRSFY